MNLHPLLCVQCGLPLVEVELIQEGGVNNPDVIRVKCMLDHIFMGESDRVILAEEG